jgi:hypothetical protein
MARRIKSFGVLILLVTVAVVLYLASRAWTGLVSRNPAVAPTTSHADRLEREAGPGELPDLGQTRRATSAHAQDVQTALGEADR